MMLRLPVYLAVEYDIPRAVFREAYRNNERYRRDLAESVSPIRDACVEAGLVTPSNRRWWTALGAWS